MLSLRTTGRSDPGVHESYEPPEYESLQTTVQQSRPTRADTLYDIDMPVNDGTGEPDRQDEV